MTHASCTSVDSYNTCYINHSDTIILVIPKRLEIKLAYSLNIKLACVPVVFD